MAQEIEKKFTVSGNAWRKDVVSQSRIIQGYLTASGTAVRVRLKDDEAFLTIKGKAEGISRAEYEYPIDVADAKEMLATLALYPPVEKIRYLVPAGNGLTWEIDEYFGANAPLFTAEIELPQEDTPFEIPSWLGEDISFDSRYTNRALSRRPYGTWEKES
ncbi:MAG: CYTH domain-containing protein [Lentisphaeria bacterium]|nr:CYTH domain-containing protein [Lentisphaeria bacterium]